MGGMLVSPTDSEAIAAALARPNYVTPGITQQHLEENRDSGPIIAILLIGVFVFLTLLLRCYARISVQKQFGFDDALAVLTMLPYVSFIVLCLILIRLGSGRHIEYIEFVLDNETTLLTEVLDFAAHLLYTAALFVCRLSGLAFYKRIGNRHAKLSKIINGAAVFLCLAFVPQMVLIIIHCRPLTGYWPYGWQAEVNNYTCLSWGTVYVTNSGLSLVCDLVIFVIPAAIISMVKRSTAGKIKLSLVLFPGVLVIAISCVRLFLVVRGQWEPDQSWVYDPFLAIENAEIGGTLFALCVPALKPLVSTFSKSVSGSFFGSGYLRSSRTPKDEKLIKAAHYPYAYEMSREANKASTDQSTGHPSEEVMLDNSSVIMKRTEVRTTVIERDGMSP